MPKTTTLLGILGRALLRPRVLGSMIRAAWRFRARRWWLRPPFLPVPPRTYLDWRMHTAYGDEGRTPTAGELGSYLRWANRLSRTRRKGGRP
ncbi:MAG: hypothetical protein GWM90_04870 [Gemmatimonadetes bacterium]|nr:hypothetical protein [Gemmatimonadota bacterium]NIQ53040.1 hypothetical protein [Gemmatimonadota bacterium]NIU73184.1 hypothetical protein [Gammaproteobacteria bacterium]NIX43473.1 hypothetical protein [Gemmatimonadota bacterium]NIY07652.1 hypothetical protein [Gemmatimonadota bacterium]